jgi:hypothetical protein
MQAHAAAERERGAAQQAAELQLRMQALEREAAAGKDPRNDSLSGQIADLHARLRNAEAGWQAERQALQQELGHAKVVPTD